MKSRVEGSTPEAAGADSSLDKLVAHLRACYPESEQLLKGVNGLGWRSVTRSAVARGDGRAELAVREAIAPLLADGYFKSANAVEIYFFGAHGRREETDSAVEIVRQVAVVPYVELFAYWLTDKRMGDELEIHLLLYGFPDELAAVSRGADS